MVEMNTTPLIDVMLVLLALLIITLPIQTHAVKLDMPAGRKSAAAVGPAAGGQIWSISTARFTGTSNQ